MRRLGICEEKGSGVDKVIQAAEAFQLPAPDFRVGGEAHLGGPVRAQGFRRHGPE